jgi:gliding motility-associated-like protein
MSPAGAFSAAGAPTITGFGCTINGSASCGNVPDPPYAFNVELLEGCTNSEITLSQTVGPQADWQYPGGNLLNSAGTGTAVVWYPTQGWYNLIKNGAPYGNPSVTYTEFLNIFTDRLLPGIRTYYNGVPLNRVCAGEAIVVEHIPALGRFGDANTTEWQWTFPGGSIDAAGNPVPPSVRAQADPGAIYYLNPGAYPIILRAKHDCCGWSRPIVDTIYVLPKPQVSIIGPDEICATGPMPTFQAVPSLPLSIDPNPEFQWFINSTPQTFTFVPYSAGGHLFTPASLNNNDTIKVRIRSSSPLYCYDAVLSWAKKVITVSAPSQGGFAYINSPGITTLQVCPGEQHTVGVVGQSNTAYTTYQWQVSTDGGATWTDVLSGVVPTITTAPIVNDPTLYRVVVTNGSCPPAISTPVTFTLSAGANPGVASVTSPTPICPGQTATLQVTGHSGAIVWEYTTTPWIATSWTTTSFTSATITTWPLTQTTYFRVKAIAGAGPCAAAYSNIVAVPVHDAPVAGNILVDPNPACSGSNVLLVLDGYSGNFIQWQQLVGTTWTNIGPNSSSWTFGPVTGTTYIRALVYNQGCGPAITPVKTINVVPGTNYGVNLAVSANPICSGDAVTFTAIPTGAPPSPTFQFYVNGTPVVSTGNTFTTSTLNDGDNVWVVMSVNSACGSGTFVSNQIQMTVNPRPTVSISAAAPGPYCEGTPVTFNATVSHPGATVEWYVNGTFTGVTGTTFTTTSLNNNDRVHAEAILGPCRSAPSNQIQVTILPQPTVVISADRNPICEGTLVTFTAVAYNAGPFPTYQWQINTGSGWVDLPGATGNIWASDTLRHNYVIRCVVTSTSGCSGPGSISNPITMVVNPLPTVSITASATSICQGQPVTFVATPSNAGPSPSYQWYINSVPVGPNANVFTTTSLNNGDVVTCVVTSTAGCSDQTLSRSNAIVMTVNPIPSVLVNPVDPVVCAGDPVTFSALVTGGTPGPLTYEWYVNGVAQGVNAPSFGPVVLNNGDQVQVSVQTAAGCESGLSVPSTVTVEPLPITNITASATTVCAGQSVSFTANVFPPAVNPTYDWQVNGVSQGINSPVFSYVPANGDVVTCAVTTQRGCQGPASNAITITVNPIPTVTVSAVPGTTVCEGTPITFTANVTDGGPAPSFQWYLNGNPIGPNSPTFILNTPQNGDVVQVRVTSTAGCTGPASLSLPITLTVNPAPQVTLTANPAGPICAGQTVNFTATNIPGATYTWYVNGVAVQSGPSSAYSTSTLNDGDQVWVQATSSAGCIGPVSNTYTAVVQPAPSISITVTPNPVCAGQPATFNAIVTNGGSNPVINWYVNGVLVASGTSTTYTTSSLNTGDQVYATVQSSGGCLSGPSNTLVITVSPQPTVTVTASATNICQGATVTFTATPNNAGPTPTYTWYVNGTPVASGPSNTYVTSSLPPGNNTIYVRITSTTGCSGPGSVSPNVNVQVEPQPTVTVTASATTICPGQSVQFIASASAPVTYQWFLNGTAVPGATAPTWTSSTLNDGDVVYVVVSTAGGCTAQSTPIAITVQGQPTVSVSVNPPSATICQGQTIVFTATASGAGPSPSFQWYVNNIAVGTNSPVFSTSTLQNGDVVTVRVTSSGGCTGASSLSAPILVTVHPNPTVQIQASANPICAGQSVLFTSTVSNAGPTPTYQWQVNGVNVPGATGPTFIATGLNNGDAVQLLVTSSYGCPAGGQPSNQIVMTVHPVPTITLTQTPAGTVCRGSQVTFTVGGAPAGATYQWTLNGNPLPGVTTGTYITDSLRNGDVVAVTVTSAQGCVSNTASITASVVNGPIADFTPPAPRCVYQTYDFQNSGSTGAGLLYFWDFGTSATPSTSNLENPTGILFSTPGPKSVTFTITDPATGCSHSVTKTVYVKPQPTAAIGAVPNLCLGLPYSFQQVGTTDPTAIFLWQFLPDGQPNVSTSPNPVGITFPTPGPKTAQLIVIVDGCADTAEVNFVVDSTLRVDLGPDRVVCPSDLPIVLDAGPGGTTYEWTLNGQPIGGNTQTLSVTQGGIYAVRVTTATGCVGQDAVNIQVSSQIPVDLGPDITLCASGGTSVTLYSGYPGATHTWTYNGQVIPGATADSLVVTQPGTYGVTVQPAGSSCIGQDFVTVRFDTAITVNLGPDVFYCTTDPIQPLQAPVVGGATYVWYRNNLTVPGANGPSLTPSGSGTYVVVVLAGSCIGTDTVQVTISPTVQVTLPDTIRFCQSNPLVELEAPYYPGATYEWTLNGVSVARGVGLYRLLDTRGGVWRVTITTASGCSGTAATYAEAIQNPRPDFETEPPIPARIAASNPVVRFINRSQGVTPYTFFRWDFGDSTTSTDPNPTHRFPGAGTYYVTLYMYNGQCVDSIRRGPIVIAPVDGSFIPSAFTPNGDGVNDQFYFPALGYQDYELLIYNRWGQLVFHKKLGETRYWDGYEEGPGPRRPAPEGVYVYVFKGIKDNGERESFTGTITLTR